MDVSTECFRQILVLPSGADCGQQCLADQRVGRYGSRRWCGLRAPHVKCWLVDGTDGALTTPKCETDGGCSRLFSPASSSQPPANTFTELNAASLHCTPAQHLLQKCSGRLVTSVQSYLPDSTCSQLQMFAAVGSAPAYTLLELDEGEQCLIIDESAAGQIDIALGLCREAVRFLRDHWRTGGGRKRSGPRIDAPGLHVTVDRAIAWLEWRASSPLCREFGPTNVCKAGQAAECETIACYVQPSLVTEGLRRFARDHKSSDAEELRTRREEALAWFKEDPSAIEWIPPDLLSDRTFVLAAVNHDGWALRQAPSELQRDREVVLAAVRSDGLAMQYAAPWLRSDREVVIEAVKTNGRALQYASDDLRCDRNICIAAVTQNALSLRYISSGDGNDAQVQAEVALAASEKNGAALRFADRNAVLAAVARNGALFRHVPIGLKDDEQVALTALSQDPTALQYASIQLRSQRDFMLKAVRRRGVCIAYASDELKSDKEVALAAVSQNVMAVRAISVELRSDADFALAAVETNPEVMKYHARAPKQDLAFITTAVSANGAALRHCQTSIRANSEIALTAIRSSAAALPHVAASLWADRAFALAAVAIRGRSLNHVAPALGADRDIVLAAVSQDGCSLEFAGGDLTGDATCVLRAIENDGWAIQFANKALWMDSGFAYEAVQRHGLALQFAPDHIKHDRRLVLAAVKTHGLSLAAVSPGLRVDREVVLAAVMQDGRALRHVPDSLREDLEIVLTAVRQDGRAMRFAGSRLRHNPTVLEASALTTNKRKASDVLSDDGAHGAHAEPVPDLGSSSRDPQSSVLDNGESPPVSSKATAPTQFQIPEGMAESHVVEDAVTRDDTVFESQVGDRNAKCDTVVETAGIDGTLTETRQSDVAHVITDCRSVSDEECLGSPERTPEPHLDDYHLVSQGPQAVGTENHCMSVGLNLLPEASAAVGRTRPPPVASCGCFPFVVAAWFRSSGI